MKTYLKFEVNYHFSSLSFVAEVNFWRPPKIFDSCDLFMLIIIITIIIFFRRVVSECTEAITTSLIRTNFPEICAYNLQDSVTMPPTRSFT